MLMLRDEINYLISVRHYFHTTMRLIENAGESAMRANASIAKVAEDQYPRVFEYLHEPLQRLMTDANDDCAELKHTLDNEIYRHADTIAAHRKFMSRWDGKISAMFMNGIRLAMSLERLKSYIVLYMSGNAGREDAAEAHAAFNIPDDEWRKLLADDEACETIVASISSFQEDVLGAYSTTPSSDDFIQTSSLRRSQRLEQLLEDSNSATLSKLNEVLGTSLTMTIVRAKVNQIVRHALESRFTKELLKEAPEMFEGTRLGGALKDPLYNLHAAIETQLSAEVANKLTGTDDEIGNFVRSVVKLAMRKAFSLLDKRSSVLTGIDNIVENWLADELNYTPKVMYKTEDHLVSY